MRKVCGSYQFRYDLRCGPRDSVFKRSCLPLLHSCPALQQLGSKLGWGWEVTCTTYHPVRAGGHMLSSSSSSVHSIWLGGGGGRNTIRKQLASALASANFWLMMRQLSAPFLLGEEGHTRCFWFRHQAGEEDWQPSPSQQKLALTLFFYSLLVNYMSSFII